MLKLVEGQQPNLAAFQQFAQSNALANRISASPKWVPELLKKSVRETIDGRLSGNSGEQHGNFDARLAINAWMHTCKVRDDGGLAAAAFANNGKASRFSGCPVAVKTCLDTCKRAFEQRIFHQYTLTAVHQFSPRVPSCPEPHLHLPKPWL